MDFTAAVVNGCISGFIGLGMTLAGLKVLRARLIAGFISDFVAIIGQKENQDTIRTAIDGEIYNYVQKGLKAVHENPKILTPIIKGLMEDIGTAMPEGATKSLEGIADSPIGDMAIQFVPKKYRFVAFLAKTFMGGNGGGKKTTAESATKGF